jgi:hypothetical protein
MKDYEHILNQTFGKSVLRDHLRDGNDCSIGKVHIQKDCESRFLLNICLFCFVRGQRYIGYLGLHLVPAAYRTEYRNISTDKIVEWSELNHAFVRVI